MRHDTYTIEIPDDFPQLSPVRLRGFCLVYGSEMRLLTIWA